MKVAGVWTWVGTRKVLTEEATNWAPKEPNSIGQNEDCVEMYIQRTPESNGRWNDMSCNKKKRPLCYTGEEVA